MQRPTVASPRLGVVQPLISSGLDSPSKRDHASHLWKGKAAAHTPEAGSRTNLLVSLGLVLNLVIMGLLLFRSCTAPSEHAATGGMSHTQFSVDPSALSSPATSDPVDSVATAALIAAHAREVTTLQASLTQLKSELAEAKEMERLVKLEAKEAKQETKEAREQHRELQKQYKELQESAKAPAAAPIVIQSDGHCNCRDQSRLASDDLALLGSKFDLAQHEFEWKCDEALVAPRGNQTFCPETATSEQYFQLTFFDRPGAGRKVAVRNKRPVSPTCVQLPPRDYVFPPKHAQLPVPAGQAGVHWPNLRVSTLSDLLVFNRGTPKNLYHFNASFYDYEQEAIVAHAARYIPFDQKVRLMLDIGSGGGSLGLLLKRRYDIQVVSTVFADWPYCEYITERGNVCMYLDAMEAMPFAKFSYDLLHSSWVFHALLNHQLVHTFLEQNRILRPGGYIWLNGGWSHSQVETIENLFLHQLGYQAIYNHKKPVAKPGHTKFDTVPYELDWEAIMVKPIRADETCRIAQEAHNQPKQPKAEHGRRL